MSRHLLNAMMLEAEECRFVLEENLIGQRQASQSSGPLRLGEDRRLRDRYRGRRFPTRDRAPPIREEAVNLAPLVCAISCRVEMS